MSDCKVVVSGDEFNNFEPFPFQHLPIELQINVLKFCTGVDVIRFGITCKEYRNFVRAYRNSLPTIQIYYLEIDSKRMKIWTDRASRIRIPINDDNWEELEANVRGTKARVLSIAEASDRLIDFVEHLISDVGFKFEHLELEREIRCDIARISRIISLSKAAGILFDTRETLLDASLFDKDKFKTCNTIYFGMESGIKDDILELCPMSRLVAHQCDALTDTAIVKYFKKWYNGDLQIDCVRISVNRRITFDSIFGDMKLTPTENAFTWTIQNKAKQTGKLTVRQSSVHFFVVLEVNCDLEDVIYRKHIFEVDY